MTHNELKAFALSKPKVKAEYDSLQPEFALLRALLVARSQVGLTQAQLAKRMGTKPSVVAKLESSLINHEKKSPSLTLLKQYAEAVGCHLDIKIVPRQSHQGPALYHGSKNFSD